MNDVKQALIVGILLTIVYFDSSFAAGLYVDDGVETTFTIAVIPDTQNYLDYRHQTAEGFPLNGNELFIQQMQFIADNVESNGGEISFVTSLGDVWQHPTLAMDPEHYARGFRAARNPLLEEHLAPTDKARTIEMPKAHEGFSLIAGKVPFSVAPGKRLSTLIGTRKKSSHT